MPVFVDELPVEQEPLLKNMKNVSPFVSPLADHRYEFEVKARHKGLDPDSLQEKLEGKVAVFRSRWESSLKDQIAELPPFDQVHRELGKHFRALFK